MPSTFEKPLSSDVAVAMSRALSPRHPKEGEAVAVILLYLTLKEVFWYDSSYLGPLEAWPWVLGGCTYLVGS